MQHIAGSLLLPYQSEKNCVRKRCCFRFSHLALNKKTIKCYNEKLYVRTISTDR
jgi:hypothetical protein